MNHPVVRAFRGEDLPSVRAICCDTAFYGQPIEVVFADRDIVGDSLVSYYAQFEPDSSFVAESDGRVVGYLNGCLDTRRFEKLYARTIVPLLLGKAFVRGHWLRPVAWRLLLALARIGRAEMRDRDAITAEYPAHCHVNLAADARRAGIGSMLLTRFFEHLRERKVGGVHVSVATEQGKAFFAKAGFQKLTSYRIPRMPAPAPLELCLMGRKV